MTKPEKSTTRVASDSAKMKTSSSFCLLWMFRVLVLSRRKNVMSPFNLIHTILQDVLHALIYSFYLTNCTHACKFTALHPPV